MDEPEGEEDPVVARHRARISGFKKSIKDARSRKSEIMSTMSDAEMS